MNKIDLHTFDYFIEVNTKIQLSYLGWISKDRQKLNFPFLNFDKISMLLPDPNRICNSAL